MDELDPKVADVLRALDELAEGLALFDGFDGMPFGHVLDDIVGERGEAYPDPVRHVARDLLAHCRERDAPILYVDAREVGKQLRTGLAVGEETTLALLVILVRRRFD